MLWILYLLTTRITALSITKQSQSSKPVNLCIHCKHIRRGLYDTKYAKCGKFPEIKEEDDSCIDGRKPIQTTDYAYCVHARKDESRCGLKGKQFEPM